jgi:hypothetical protein
MTSPYRRLGEGLAAKQPPAKDAFQTDPRALRQWIAALPMANAGATARLLYQALRELNNIAIDPNVRLAALEALRAPIGQIADWVDRQIVGSTFPLPPQKQQLGTIARDFQHELALGYRTTVFNFCGPDGKVPFLKGKSVALALERAIAHLGAQLSKAYLLYATPPTGLWKTMHDLYRFAVLTRLDDKPVEDPLLGEAELTPRAAYAHALLLAISNPYRLTQKEIHDSYLVTRVWAPGCRIGEGRLGDRAFAVPLDSDAGPGYLPEERSGDAAAVLSFDPSPLEAELERQLSLVAGVGGAISFRLRNAPAVSIGPDLVRRLMQSWQPLSDRTHARLPAGHQLDTLIGLHAVHYYLAGAVDFETFVRRTCGPAVHFNERDRAASWTTAPDAGKPECFGAVVRDQSLGGYRIEWEGAASVRARVGEVIGLAPLAEEGEEQDWMVGLIRWMRIDPHGKVDAGIELLARQARAAVLRVIDGAGHPKPPVRAVHLEMGRANGDGEAAFHVLAPSVLERGAPKYELTTSPPRYSDDDEPETRELPSISVVDQSGSYVRFAPRSEPHGASGHDVHPPAYDPAAELAAGA